MGISLDETATIEDVQGVSAVFAAVARKAPEQIGALIDGARESFRRRFGHTSAYLTHPVFNTHRSRRR